MRSNSLRPLSLLAGAAIAVLAVIAMAQDSPSGKDWEYQIMIDADEEDIEEAADEGWQYVGYLGRSIKGSGSDETLWRRAK